MPASRRGGARTGTGPKGPRPPRLTLEETIAALERDLAHKPAQARVSTARAALKYLESLQAEEQEWTGEIL
jgi:hypothetical protein